MATAEDIALVRLYIDEPNDTFLDNTAITAAIDRFTVDSVADLNAAASELWGVKAAKVSTWYQTGLDGAFLSRDQVFQHCLTMARFYEERGSGTPGSMRSVRMGTDYEDDEEASSEL